MNLKRIGIIVNLLGVGMLVAGLTGKLDTSYETDVMLMKWGISLGLVGLGIVAWAISKSRKSS